MDLTIVKRVEGSNDLEVTKIPINFTQCNATLFHEGHSHISTIQDSLSSYKCPDLSNVKISASASHDGTY